MPDKPHEMRLAIATANPDATAETYVRQHMRLIFPGRTVGVGLKCKGPPTVDIPFYWVDRNPHFFSQKLSSITQLVLAGYSGAISKRNGVELAKFLESHGVTTILAEFGPTGCALRHFCKQANIRLFVNFHGYDATVMPRSPRIRYAYRLLARDAAAIICGSQHFKRVLISIGFPSDRITVIPCGVEVDEFSSAKDRDSDLILGVGRLTEKKAPELSIQAFKIASESQPNLRLELIGGGPLQDSCTKLIRDLALENRVKLHGAKSHDFVKSKLRQAGIFVQHSVTASNGDQESQGISLLEAMAASLPVVATDHNGFSETVIHGETGLLSREFDVPKMAENILRIHQSEKMRSTFGANGRKRVEDNFEASIIADKLRVLLFGSENVS